MIKTKKNKKNELREWVFIHKGLLNMSDIARNNNISQDLVSKIIKGNRNDLHGVIKIASQIIKRELKNIKK